MPTLIDITIDEQDLKRLVIEHLSTMLNTSIEPQDVTIKVKTSLTYRDEWEEGNFRATVHKAII